MKMGRNSAIAARAGEPAGGAARTATAQIQQQFEAASAALRTRRTGPSALAPVRSARSADRPQPRNLAVIRVRKGTVLIELGPAGGSGGRDKHGPSRPARGRRDAP